MARLFDDASGDLLQSSTTPITAVGFTIVGKFRADSLPGQDAIISISDSNTPGTQGQWGVAIHNNTNVNTGSYLTCWSREGSGLSTDINQFIAAASTTCTQDQWHSFVAVFAANNDRRIFLDGGNKGTNTVASTTQSGIDNVEIGRLGDSTPNFEFSGDIAEIAIYDYVFSDADAAIFTNDFSPLLHRPDQILSYWPLLGNVSPEPDIVGNHNATVTGATKSSHPAIIYPSGQILQFPPAGAAPPVGGRIMSSLAHHGGLAGMGGIAGTGGGLAG